ncbi:hypothetical protein N7E02_01410 (plasmid) [Aliirhizobium terrae]|uniref:hypothetical protein n=1 Tax=Terrirhizobium terrae TaxID=2926709 RepID=UPI002574C2CC|nr:hypothetical protein [Rhizobium sp. CC-CFT758]WJH38081.1 hypothetical protein N7E02_01410 [Rhizobium sp. CC-CFT758]
MSNRLKEAACEGWHAGGSYLCLLGDALRDRLIKGRTVKFFKKRILSCGVQRAETSFFSFDPAS